MNYGSLLREISFILSKIHVSLSYNYLFIDLHAPYQILLFHIIKCTLFLNIQYEYDIKYLGYLYHIKITE